jgi:hypothetical protein
VRDDVALLALGRVRGLLGMSGIGQAGPGMGVGMTSVRVGAHTLRAQSDLK